MSDGPHRSLPLRRHWKILAERAAREAYPVFEVGEALGHALKNEFLETPLAEICKIIDGAGQGNLFSDTRIDGLESLRRYHCGSAATNIVIDCAIDAVNGGMTGRQARISVLKEALAGYSFSVNRSIEEHYLRKAGSNSAGFIRDRLEAAYQRCNFDNIASEMLVADWGSRNVGRLPLNLGLDAGPML